ncbi:unnamed protein product [Rotaria socialis]|uniref:Ankyrin repeat protein n=1 Tax=Rotaria socialis TaxID=392032 RepID=A0A817T5P0_9BILA|nr:unnamed protein product [Rotaria socialis]CAF3339170.1 unnamed protein product [Rotaria socialis]CAF4352791.1 unnamed protein product [Rotaria socialis]CAF4656036.1 unnamed protein product [Rotaria socialis]
MAGPGERNEAIDLHELCIEGNFAELKSALNSSKDIDVNRYKLFVYRPLPNSSTDTDGLVDVDEDYQSDEDISDSGTMFDYRSPLFYAILHDRLACVKLLIEHGANTEKLRPWGLNALCLSCFCGHVRLVEYFLNLNLNVNLTDKPNVTDNYFGSLSNEHEHKIKMREMHSRVAQDMGMFHYPLHVAIKQDSIQLIKLLLNYKHKFDMEITEAYTKRTALHIAAGKCSTEIICLLLEEGQSEENSIDLNGHTPLDIVWKLLNNLDYQFEYREETLKLMLSHKCRFSSLKSLTEFYANSLSAFRRFESNFWIVIAYDLSSLFLNSLENNKILLVHIWLWFNRNYQDTVMEDDEFDRHYTGSILRNLIHVMYENEQLTLTNHELAELFTEDLGSHFDKATDEIDTITTILSTPLKLKQICRNRIRKRLCCAQCGGLNRQTLEHSSLSPPLNEALRHFILP